MTYKPRIISIYINSNSVGNVGIGEDTIYSYSIDGNSLNNNGEAILADCVGIFAASLNNKRLRVKYGGTTIFDSGSLAITAATDWSLKVRIMRTGAATQKCSVEMSSSSAVLSSSSDYSTATETLSGAVVFTVTAEATTDNDIVGEFIKVFWERS